MTGLDSLTIELTSNCNLECTYCLNEYDEKITKERDLKLDEVISLINSAKRIGCNVFSLTGGEPLLFPDIGAVINEIQENVVVVYTNGILLQSSTIKNILEKINHLVISLDGIHHNNFYRKKSDYNVILKNMQYIKENYSHITIGINTMITDKSVVEINALYKQLKDLQIDEWHIGFPQVLGHLSKTYIPIYPDRHTFSKNITQLIKDFCGDEKPFYLKIYKLYDSALTQKSITKINMKEHPCEYAFDGSLSVDYNGNFYFCKSLQQYIKFGHLGNSIEDIINKKKQVIDKFFSFNYSDLNGCKNCRYFDLCLGGCRGEAWSLNCSYTNPDCISCLVMDIAEKEIYPNLPVNVKNIYLSLINNNGDEPKSFDSINNIYYNKMNTFKQSQDELSCL